MKKTFLAALLLTAGGLALAPLAHADLISIGLQATGVNGGAITTEGTGSGTAVVNNAGYGAFTANIITADDTVGSSLPELLNSTALNISSNGTAGTITIWVTAQTLTQPTGTFPVLSNLTSNTLPTGWTVTESTFYDAGNGLFSTATPLSSHMFSAIGTNTLTSSPVAFTSPFSITERYILTSTAGTPATALSTIHTTVVPEPGSLLLLGTALIGIGAVGFARRRRRA